MTVGAEIFHNTGLTVGQAASTGFNVGGSYNFDEHNHLLLSAGKWLQNAANTNRVSTYIGYQFTFSAAGPLRGRTRVHVGYPPMASIKPLTAVG